MDNRIKNPLLSDICPIRLENNVKSPKKLVNNDAESIDCQIDRLNLLIQSIMKGFQPIEYNKILEKHTSEDTFVVSEQLTALQSMNISLDDFDYEFSEQVSRIFPEEPDEDLFSRVENLLTAIDRIAMTCEDYRSRELHKFSAQINEAYKCHSKIDCDLYDIYGLLAQSQLIIDIVENEGSYQGKIDIGSASLDISINHNDFLIPDKHKLALESSAYNTIQQREIKSSNKHQAYINQLENEIEILKLQIALPKEINEFGKYLKDNMIDAYKHLECDEDFTIDLTKSTFEYSSVPKRISVKDSNPDVKIYKQRIAEQSRSKAELQ